AGFEADKWRLFVQDRQSGKISDVTAGPKSTIMPGEEKFDRSVGSFTWNEDHLLFFEAENRGGTMICGRAPDGQAWIANEVSEHVDDFIFGGPNVLYFTKQSAAAPNEIYSSVRGEHKQVTHINDALLSQIDMQPLESFTFKGANDEEVQGFMVKPPGFDPNKKYPLKFLIHGGPQGAWGNSWTYRWNAELFAANGYVVV